MPRRAAPRSVGRIRDVVRSWQLYLHAYNLAPRTIHSYQETALQFDAWLADNDLDTDAATVGRQHVEAWLAHLLDRWSAGTAASREIDASPMAKMRPPQVPSNRSRS